MWRAIVSQLQPICVNGTNVCIYIYVCIHVSGHFRLCGLYFSYSNGPDVFELHVKMAAAFLLVLLL